MSTTRERRSNKKVYITQVIVLVVSAIILYLGCIAILNSLELYGISGDISYLENYGISTDPNSPDNIQYNSLLNRRVEIRDSSWVGRLLVDAGGHWFTKCIRFVAIFGIVFYVMPNTADLVFYIVSNDIRHFSRKWRRYSKARAKAKTQTISVISAKEK